MSRFKPGWKIDKFDPRDSLYRKICKPRLEPLPDSVDLRDKCGPVKDQGQLGSCTAHALAGAVEFLDRMPDGVSTDVSRLFIYFSERWIEGDVSEDGGAELRDGVKVLNQCGVCDESLWPYDVTRFKERPTTECFQSAKKHMIQSYHRLLNLDEMLGCLADGFPFVFGFQVYSGFESEEVARTGVVQMPQAGEQNLGGHAVLCIGYERSTRRFLVRNSWSAAWGQAGNFTLPWEYVETLADDAWVLMR